VERHREEACENEACNQCAHRQLDVQKKPAVLGAMITFAS
jgi:hypothetical protein